MAQQIDGDRVQRLQLEKDWPEWVVWRSTGPLGEPADWYASRRRRLTGEQRRAGLHATVSADTPEELAEVLDRQAELDPQRCTRMAAKLAEHAEHA
ncbi:hypothetical protein [Microtetraspora malaysiensis]|uniref:Uncharacterized protein n=1 Tax=Microtetraspora malaysiensis TaxID=161358 RepID=A0ABW6T595_9ACTN